MVLMDDFKEIIIEKLNNILNLDYEKWNILDKKIKLKYIHRLCNFLENDENVDKRDNITIPLKSIKPKKLIQYCGYSNQYNKETYIQFNKLILNYTNDFRNKYINISKKKYYTFNNLPKEEHNLILNELNEIVCCFIKKNKINISNLLKCLIGSNLDKLIIDTNEKNYNVNFCDNNIEISINNLKIILTLKFSSSQITNNIPVIYHIKLINNI